MIAASYCSKRMLWIIGRSYRRILPGDSRLTFYIPAKDHLRAHKITPSPDAAGGFSGGLSIVSKGI